VELVEPVLRVAGWDRCDAAVVLSALRLAAEATAADVCCLVWSDTEGRLRVLTPHATSATDAEQRGWLDAARSADDGAAVADEGIRVAAIRSPDGRTAGALVVRSAIATGELVLAAARHLELLLASSEAHTERSTAYEALFEIGTQIQAHEVHADTIFALIVERARGLLRTDVAWLAMVDDERRRLGMKVAVGTTTPDFMRMQVRVGTGIGGIALKERRPVAVHDSRIYDNGMPRSVHRALDDEGVRSILCAPMLRDDGMLGALYVGTRSPRRFSEEEASLMWALAAQAAVTIENARLYQELAEKNESVERAFAIHRHLTDASLAGVGLDRIALELARLVERDLVLALADGPGRWARYPRHPAAHAPAELGGPPPEVSGRDPDLEIVGGAAKLGTLFALGDDPLSALQRKALEHGATVIALELVKEQAALEVEWRLQGELLEELLRCEAPFPEAVRRRAERFAVELEAPHRVAVLQASTTVTTSRMLDVVRTTLRHRGQLDALVAQRGERVLVALADGVPGGPLQMLAELQRRARLAKAPFVAGLSSARRDFRIALREAEGALALALSSPSKEPERITRYEDLGPLRFMLDSPNANEMVALVQDVLGPLAEHDARRRSDLLFTLRAYLSCGGHHPTTAERCHIHTSTLKYRLSRIAAILDRSLNDPRARFELSLALEVLDVLEVLGAAPFPTRAS
jgi:DNA-binding PucR family transcriptional regulator/putative methionine-R-sulfoxide reductase with GAF domain